MVMVLVYFSSRTGALRRDGFNFEVRHTIVPDILGGGLGLVAPVVEHLKYRFHWTGG